MSLRQGSGATDLGGRSAAASGRPTPVSGHERTDTHEKQKPGRKGRQYGAGADPACHGDPVLASLWVRAGLLSEGSARRNVRLCGHDANFTLMACADRGDAETDRSADPDARGSADRSADARAHAGPAAYPAAAARCAAACIQQLAAGTAVPAGTGIE